MVNKRFFLFFIVLLLIPIVYGTTSSDLNVSLGLVNNTAPSQPILISPLNDSNLSYNYVVLDWNDSTDINNQTIRYLVCGDIANATTLLTNTTSSSYIWTGLDILGNYSWKVVASDGIDINTSQTWQFTRIGGAGIGGGGVVYPSY